MRLARAAVLLLLLPLTALAQRITITPQVGLYAPLRDQGMWVERFCDRSLDDDPCDIAPRTQTYRLDLKPGVDVGLKLVVEWEGIGFESFVSTATLTRQAGVDGSEYYPARNTVAGLRFAFRRRLSGRSDLTLRGGLASMALLSPSYCAGGSRCITNRNTWVLTPGAALEIAMMPQTRLELSIVDYIYTVRYGPQWLGNPPPFVLSGDRSSYGQHDLVISAGLGIVVRQ